jgi:predicted nucleotidyltransferase
VIKYSEGMTDGPSELDAAIAGVLADYDQVAAGYIFGSMARGAQTRNSDLDVAVVFARRGAGALQHHRDLGDIANRLEGLSPSGRVDVIAIESQGPVFQHRVLAEARLVFERDRWRRIDFESDAHVRYFDWRPTYEIARRAHRRGFRRWLESRR